VGFTDDAGNQEGDGDEGVDLFHGIGTYARPPSGRGAAVVLLAGGKSGAPMVVATRDVKTLLAVLKKRAVGDDEALFHNSVAGMHVKASGELELRTHDGTAEAPATKADVDRIWRYLYAQFSTANGHTHVVSGAATTTIATVPPAPSGNPAATPPTAVPPAPVGAKKVRVE
jgi:phage gp45-like